MLILSAVIVSFAACGSDDDDEGNGPQFQVSEIGLITSDGKSKGSFEYDGQNRVSKFNMAIEDMDISVLFTYGSQGELLSMKMQEDGNTDMVTYTYTYVKDTIFQKIKEGADHEGSFDTLIVNDKGNLLKMLTHRRYTKTFEYDNTDRLTKSREAKIYYYIDQKVEYITEYRMEYGGENKLMKILNMPNWFQHAFSVDDDESYPILSSGMLTKITKQDYERIDDGAIEKDGEPYSSVFRYEYDANGYPTEITFLENEDDEKDEWVIIDLKYTAKN